MKKIFLSLTVLSVCASLSAGVSFLGYLYPSGGQRGTTVKVIAGGQRIGGRVTLLTETPGIKIKSVMVIPYMGYFQPPQRKWLTQFMKNLYNGKQERPPIPENPEGYTWRKHKWLDEPEKLPLLERSLVAHSLFVRANPLQAAPSIASRLLIELEIAPNAPVGPAKIRLVSGRNISNEKLFFIDDAPQITEPPYYPDFAKKTVAKLLAQEADLGILVCGSGIGISIAANRHKGIRAALLYDDYVAKVAREHNNANVLCFGGRTMSTEDVLRRIGIFLKAEYEGGRHDRRLCKMDLD